MYPLNRGGGRQIDLLKHRGLVEAVNQSAQRELECEEQLEALAKRWQTTALVFANFKNLGPVLLDLPDTRQIMEVSALLVLPKSTVGCTSCPPQQYRLILTLPRLARSWRRVLLDLAEIM